MNNLHNLTKIKTQTKKRIGRGSGSGSGTTAGRGTKGQKSRSGVSIPARFQGGSLPLWQRLPKNNGIKSRSLKPVIINLLTLEKHYSDNEEVSLESLEKKGLIISKEVDKKGIKILGFGQLSKKLKFDPSLKTSKSVKNS